MRPRPRGRVSRRAPVFGGPRQCSQTPRPAQCRWWRRRRENSACAVRSLAAWRAGCVARRACPAGSDGRCTDPSGPDLPAGCRSAGLPGLRPARAGCPGSRGCRCMNTKRYFNRRSRNARSKQPAGDNRGPLTVATLRTRSGNLFHYMTVLRSVGSACDGASASVEAPELAYESGTTRFQIVAGRRYRSAADARRRAAATRRVAPASGVLSQDWSRAAPEDTEFGRPLGHIRTGQRVNGRFGNGGLPAVDFAKLYFRQIVL